MATKPRSPDQTAVSVSLEKGLLERIDERASALGLNRSQYLAHLARADLSQRGELVLKEETSVAPPRQEREGISYPRPKRKAV